MNSPRQILSELASIPPEQVKHELNGVQAELVTRRAALEGVQADIARLEIQEGLLAQMLRMHQWEPPQSTNGVVVPESHTVRGPVHGSVAQSALNIVLKSDVPLSRADVRRALAADGVEASGENVRQALRRSAEREKLVKLEDGRYVRPDLAPLTLTDEGVR